MQQQNGVIPRDEKKKSLGEVLSNFLDYSKLNKKTYTHDRGRINLILTFWKDSRTAESIYPKDIDDLKKFLLKEGKSEVTINLYLDLLSSAYNRGIEDNLIKTNPFNRKYKFKRKNYSVRYLTHQEEKSLFSVSPDYFKPLLEMALNTGLRRTNIIELKWSNIDFKYRVIELLKNKGNKHIRLPINDRLFKVLSNMEKSSEYVFVNPLTNAPYCQTTFTKLWDKIRTKADLKDFRFHDLRHTVGTRMAEKLVPVNVIKEVIAHTDIRTTQRYIHFASEQLTSAMEVLNSYN